MGNSLTAVYCEHVEFKTAGQNRRGVILDVLFMLRQTNEGFKRAV